MLVTITILILNFKTNWAQKVHSMWWFLSPKGSFNVFNASFYFAVFSKYSVVLDVLFSQTYKLYNNATSVHSINPQTFPHYCKSLVGFPISRSNKAVRHKTLEPVSSVVFYRTFVSEVAKPISLCTN